MSQTTLHEARHLLPGDLFRDDGRLLRIARIAVSLDTVEITADILIDGAARGSATLRGAADKPVRIHISPPEQAPAQRDLISA